MHQQWPIQNWRILDLPESEWYSSLIPKISCCFETTQIWGIWKLRPAYSPETPNLGQNRWCFVPCDLEIWWMTLENNRASLLCCFKLCATFHSHRWIQAVVTVRKCSIWVKVDYFKSCVTLKFDGWPWKTIGHLFNATSSFVHHFVAIDDSKLKLQSRNAQFGSKSTIFRAMWPCNLTCDLEKQKGTFSMLRQALCIIPWPSVNSSWSYSPETPNLGHNHRFF